MTISWCNGRHRKLVLLREMVSQVNHALPNWTSRHIQRIQYAIEIRRCEWATRSLHVIVWFASMADKGSRRIKAHLDINRLLLFQKLFNFLLNSEFSYTVIYDLFHEFRVIIGFVVDFSDWFHLVQIFCLSKLTLKYLFVEMRRRQVELRVFKILIQLLLIIDEFL